MKKPISQFILEFSTILRSGRKAVQLRNRVIVFLLIGIILLTGCAMNFDPPMKEGAGTTHSSKRPSGSLPSDGSTPEDEGPADEVYLDPTTGIYYEHYEREGEISDRFELPLEGATGYAPLTITVRDEASKNGSSVATLSPGDAFVILEEKDDRWWYITKDGSWNGWVDNTYCYLNIPDVIPSIVFNNTNGYASMFVSSGQTIPKITGEQLYESKFWNERLGEEEFVMAANYAMVKKIYAAQQAALAEGYTLVLYESFRPRDVQRSVVTQMNLLCDQDSTVRAGVKTSPWSMTWFISEGLSNHQIGCAMDVSLAWVNRMEVRVTGKYRYVVPIETIPCNMPTEMHELSMAAVSMVRPVPSSSKTAYKDVALAHTMTDDAKRLRNYCLGAGMYPLASEWWHFNDLDAKEAIGSHYITDTFHLSASVSRVPE